MPVDVEPVNAKPGAPTVLPAAARNWPVELLLPLEVKPANVLGADAMNDAAVTAPVNVPVVPLMAPLPAAPARV